MPFNHVLSQELLESVKLAKQRLTPARIGYGTGVSYINVNRNIIDPKTKRWWEGPNYDGPSDKTVAVIKFESLTGDPDVRCFQPGVPRAALLPYRFQILQNDRAVYIVYERAPWKFRLTLRRQSGAELVEDECEVDSNDGRHHVAPCKTGR
jgi:hypothetical protein